MIKKSKKFFRNFNQKISLSSILAFIAGIVNSVSLIGFGQFVSHVSGHASYAAVEYFDGLVLLALTSALALITFIAGACFTTVLLKGNTIEDPKVNYVWPLLFEMLCIIYVVLETSYLPHYHKLMNTSQEENYLFLVLSFAMGIQNATLRRRQGFFVRTTHITGTATDLGVAMGSAIAWGIREVRSNISLWNQEKDILKFLGIIMNSFKTMHSHFQVEKLYIHFSTITFFIIGAIAGTYGFLHYEFKTLISPIIILFIIILFELKIKKSRVYNATK